MRYKGDWLIDPDGRACEDRKNGPVISYTLTPEEIEKILKGENKMTEVNARYDADNVLHIDAETIAKTMKSALTKEALREPEKKRMTRVAVIECHENGMTDDEIAEHFGYTGKAKKLALARIAKALKPEEPKVEPVEVAPAEEPITFVEKEIDDFWAGVRHELWGMKESEFDKINESFEKVLARWVGGDHSEETTAALMFYGEKVLSV